MSNIFELPASIRHEEGKGASRRLRHAHKVPAIVYGGDEKPLNISLCHNLILKAVEHEAFFAHMLTLIIDGKKSNVILRDLQRHAFKKIIMHLDFQRIRPNDLIVVKVPLHFVGMEQSAALKAGANLNHSLMHLELRCKANALPERIDVDISHLEPGMSIHAQDLKLPKGVTCLHPEQAIASIHK